MREEQQLCTSILCVGAHKNKHVSLHRMFSAPRQHSSQRQRQPKRAGAGGDGPCQRAFFSPSNAARAPVALATLAATINTIIFHLAVAKAPTRDPSCSRSDPPCARRSSVLDISSIRCTITSGGSSISITFNASSCNNEAEEAKQSEREKYIRRSRAEKTEMRKHGKKTHAGQSKGSTKHSSIRAVFHRFNHPRLAKVSM